MTTPSPRLLSLETLQHLKLSADPFEDRPGMLLHVSARTKFSRGHLVNAIRSRRMVALVAQAGGGKSTLLRLLHSQIRKSGIQVLWLSPGNLNRGTINESSLAGCILRDLGQPVPNASEDRGEALRTELERRARLGEFPTLVIDEAHDMSTEGLIAIKRIWDSYSFNRTLSVVLAGQMPLALRLRHDPAVQEVAGRMLVVEIPPMSAEEVRDYVNYRCDAVEADGNAIFADSAIEAIARTGGTAPLWVNAIGQAALDATRQLGLDAVDADAVMAARS